MRFELLHGEVAIGTSALEGFDEGMGVAYGAFVPGPAYADVQPVFRMFADADGEPSQLAAYYRARSTLGLKLRSETGIEIATSAIHISDYTADVGSDALEVEVHLASPEAFRRLTGRPGGGDVP